MMQQHPEWTQPQLARALSRSLSWVQKWQHRFGKGETLSQSQVHQIALGQSRARKTPPERIDTRIEELILEIRDHPPEGLRRTPGPKTILYYLPRHRSAWDMGCRLPRSTRTVYEILKRNQRIASQQSRPQTQESERPAPLSCWQIDFKDVSTVTDDPAEPSAKKRHVAEAFNIVDEGTSRLLHAEVRTDFVAETTLQSLAAAIERYGLPERITLDRDPRSVGAPQGSDFPSALLRFGRALGIDMHVCAPGHPWENGFVERYHRSYQQECLSWERPATLAQAQAVTAQWCEHYNRERPNQAISCGNRPPAQAFPVLPKLAAPPSRIDADGWLNTLDGKHVERKVDAHGQVQLDLRKYYVGSQLTGSRVTLQLHASTRSVSFFREATCLKTVPLKGLVGQSLSFEQLVQEMSRQAIALTRLRSLQERRRRMT
jgi:transposase InsO family protein